MERRKFLTKTGALALSALAIPNMPSYSKNIKSIGVQIYTLRDLLKEDYLPVFEQLAKLGFKEIEAFPGKGHFWGKTSKTFAEDASKFGLKVVSTHIPLGLPKGNDQSNLATLVNQFDKFAGEYAKAGGNFIVCPYFDKSLRTSLEGYKLLAAELNKAGKICNKEGIQFCYHNHEFEFQAVEGKIPYDYLLEYTDKSDVKMELDLYWATKAGVDVKNLIEKNQGRFPLLHVKDMGEPNDTTVEVGSGKIDFKAIFKLEKMGGFQHYFVEQDHCPGNPLESVGKSISYLQKLDF
jgi:sugar phosphate isomerase/epimerase